MSEPALTIRAVTLDDLPSLIVLENACFAIPWSEESLRLDIANNPAARYLAAVLPDGELVGYAACWIVLDEGQITNIAVAPPWQRRGVGQRLLEALISIAKSERLSLLTLEVRVGNTPAIRLYQGGGFVPAGLRRGYYEDNGEDAIIMLKNFQT